ncbi:peptidyl-tRNA hydrolase 2, putative [Entamoeba invadens IP1]|uniref:peptidyl-tRNA hydrolase n=1 Tax=Entamoeba invadens IP1 TaxID=370355 RepID=A0A0A1U908_ENTIV|nr:peptidyl-tRNA hydrolase 2, putative [Entamoeba invadens IP1]ELP91395.1 peptidyl-tRNA hydrolase 2, putative [Entamoeba invadens IP1]|eukprot:XP_004258166.1 peptidyl-tRNA hydrolase 2, putative [Entamoeba invadens IP1]
MSAVIITLTVIVVTQFIVIVFLLTRRKQNNQIESKEKNPDSFEEPNEEYKLVLCVRKDLKMGKGKIAAQCGHAAVGCVLKAQKTDKKALESWQYCGQAKVALNVNDLEELNELEKQAKGLGLITKKICDAGRTQVEPGSITVLGIGPGPKSVINEVTGKLKLL